MTRIKICGIKNEEHALAVAGAGADYIGFVFAPSHRQVTLEQAAGMVDALDAAGATVQKVGVFVNTPMDTILRIADSCRLDWIQLSGDEPPAFCQQLGRPVIKTYRISASYRPDDVCRHLEYADKLLGRQEHMFHLDSNAREKYGGTGIRFNWKSAVTVTEKFPVIVAGGLTPDNVAEALDIMRPWGVDISSGVETNRIKDMDKVRKFIETVRNHDAKTA